MKSIKGIFISIWISGLLLGACSSDNDIIDNPEINNKVELDLSNVQWHKGSISSQIAKGSNSDASTRSKEEIGDDENPVGKLPDNIPLYICYYDEAVGELKKETFSINKTENGYEYYYAFSQDAESGDWYAVLSNEEISDNNERENAIQIKVGQIKEDDTYSGDLFLFTSFNAVENSTIKLPTVEEAGQTDLYPNEDGTPNYVEYGDKLFASEGYFFAFGKNDEKNINNIKLYSIGHNERKPNLVEGKAVEMKRLTGVVTIYTMVVDHFESSGNGELDMSVPIEGMNREDDIKVMITKTNDVLQAALREKGLDDELRVDDYFTRKKLLTDFPLKYTWKGEALYDNENGEFGNVYLCNRNDAAWMEEKGEYQDGGPSDFIYGVCSSCDNFPFIPTGSNNTAITPDCTLRLYMGIAKRGESAPKNLLTVDVKVENNMPIYVNSSNNLFLLFTIEDLVNMAEAAGRITTTRSVSDAPDLILPSNRLIFK